MNLRKNKHECFEWCHVILVEFATLILNIILFIMTAINLKEKFPFLKLFRLIFWYVRPSTYRYSLEIV